MRWLRYTNPIDGTKIICRKAINTDKRVAIIKADKSKPYIIAILDQERMPNNENINN